MIKAMADLFDGDVITEVHRRKLLVKKADDRVKISLAFLSAIDEIDGDRVTLGTEHGNRVVYRIVGWDSSMAALLAVKVA